MYVCKKLWTRYTIQFERDNVKLGNQRHLKLTTGQLFQEVSGMKFIVFFCYRYITFFHGFISTQ